MQNRERYQQSIPLRMPQHSKRNGLLDMDGNAAHGYLARMVAVATGPRPLASSAQTRQVYFSPLLICIFGDHSVCFWPGWMAALLSFSPAAFSISNEYFA